MKEFYPANLKVFFAFIFGFAFITLASAQVPNCATANLPADGATLTRMATFTWSVPVAGAAPTGYKVFIGTTTAANEILNPLTANVTGATTTSYNYRFAANTGGLLPGVTYYWKVIATNASGDATGCTVQSFTITAAGNPAVFPVNTWNAYCYNSTTFTNYVGYYTETPSANGGFTSNTNWTNTEAPSNTVAGGGAATYLGGAMSYDNHSVIYKRQGFTPGYYTLDVTLDDNCWIYLNGNLVYSRNGNSTNLAATTVYLDASSQFEFRWNEGGGASVGSVKFNSGASLPAFTAAGSIAGNQTLCTGGANTNPTIFTSTAAASGGCGGALFIGYQWQSDVNCTGTFTNIAGATAATYDAPAGVTQTTCYRRLAVDYNCSNRTIPSNTVTVTVSPAPGNPAVFPVGSWNAYCYNSTNWTDYTGYYTATGQDFNSSSDWTSNNFSPSSASPNGAVTYQGCPVPVDNHSISYKRQGFTPGTYSLNIVNDNTCFIFLNGVQIYTTATTTAATTYAIGVATVYLDASSQLEFRWFDTGAASHGGITFVAATMPTFAAGTIGNNQSLCSGNTDPAAFVNTAAASGVCGTLSYQWQSDVNCTGTFTNIAGATAATYDAPAGVTQTTCYRRLAVDNNCGRTLPSNTVTVTVYATPPGDPTVFPIGSWNAYCYNSTNWTNYAGYYTATGQDFNSSSDWTSNNFSPSSLAPNGAVTYQGCTVPVDNHSISYKRQGFTPGTYSLNIVNDNTCFIFLNGVQIYTTATTTAATTYAIGVATVYLDASSQLEFRWFDTGAASHGGITFVAATMPTFAAGTIGNNQSLCFGNTDPAAFVNTAAASGFCGTLTYQWQSDVNCTGTFTNIAGATSATYDAPAGVTQTTCYRRLAVDNNCGRTLPSNTVTVTVYATPPGDPTVFPIGSWNAYCYNSTNWTNYVGYYTATGQDFNSSTDWTSNNFSPSSLAPNGAVTYQGCTVPVDNHSISYKRQGFTPGTYSLNIVNDNTCFIFLNGVQIHTATATTTATGYVNAVWTGNLDASSQIEFRWFDTGAASHGGITFVPIPTPTLNPGVIAGNQTLCPGNNPYIFTSTSAASGTCSAAATYKWQEDVGCTGTWVDIAGAVALTYDVPAGITQTTCYRRVAMDANCSRQDFSNTITVTVTTVPQGDPTVVPLNSWNAYVYDFTNTGYTTADNNWTDYKGFYPINTVSFNTTTIYGNAGNPPSIAAGYAGCQLMGAPLTGVQIKRQGFPTGVYQIDFTSDDAGFLYINGALIYSRTTNGNLINAWTGNLDASSTIDFRYKNSNGNGGGVLTFTVVTPTIALTEGGIALNGPASVCAGSTGSPIISTSNAASSCYFTYQWQADEGSGYIDIVGATSASYTPGTILVSTSYRRYVKDACGDDAYSNVVNISVGPSTTPDPTVFGNNSWIAYVYGQPNYAAASLAGSYTDPGISSTDPGFNSNNSWDNTLAPSSASTYTGCQIGVDNHSVSYKRQGFTAGTYKLNVLNDDASQLYVDGQLVYTAAYTPTFINAVWTGILGPTSKVEFRWTEGGGTSYGALSFILVSTPGPLDGGVISNATTQVCSGDAPTAFTSSTLPSNGCAVASYQWELNTGSGYTDITGATSVAYSLPAAQTATTSYRRRVTDACAQVAYSNVFVVSVVTPTPPDPSIFGTNVWNVYTYNDVNFTLLRGSYVDNGLSASDPSFDSRNKWGVTTTPSNAAGYTGCSVALDQHGVIYKRKGFPSGTYRLDYNSDDAGSVYINGVLVYTSVSYGTLVSNIWTGPLNSTSTIEYRWADTGGGNSYGQLVMVHPVTPATLVGGTIANASTIVCSGDSPAAFTSTAPASGGCYKAYQWQSSTSSMTGGFSDITGATALTYAPTAITTTTYYRRKVTDACSSTAYSNVFTVSVGVPSPPAITWGNGHWNAYVYNGRNFTTLYGSYIQNNISVSNYSFDSRNSWITTSRPSTASTYSGCQVGDNTFSISYRQTNFAAGTYQITMEADDDAVLIIDGVTVYTGAGICCTPVNAWTGPLTASSKVEIRYGENLGNAYCKPTITSTTPPALVPGVIGSNQSICTNVVPDAFTSVADATSGCAITYQWQRSTTSTTGPWANVGGNSSTYALAPPGQTVTSYYIRRVTDACGRTDSSNVVTVTLDSKPANAGTMTGLAYTCAGQAGVSYSIPTVAYATSYTWVVPTGSTITSGDGTNAITVTFGSTSGDVTVQPTNACGVGLTSTVSVTVAPSIPASAGAISGLTTVCQAQFSVLYSVAAVPNATSYIWTLPTGASFVSGSTTNAPRVTFGANAGTISVQPTNGCGNALTATNLAIAMNPTPNAAGNITGSGTVCPGQAGVTYSIGAVGNTATYNWSLPAGCTITSGAGTRSITVTFGSTSGNVTVTPTNNCGTGTPKSMLVSVITLGSTGTISGSTSLCQNTANVAYTIPVVTGASTYTWTVPPGATIVSGNGFRTIRVNMGTASGDVTVTPSNTCATGTPATRAITITNTIPANATAIIGDINPCRAQTGVVYSTTSTGATSYLWSVPSGTAITTGSSTNAITVTVGANSGNVVVTPSNVCGNAASATTQAIVVKPFTGAVGTISGSNSVCKESGIAYSIPAVANALTYTWSVPAGANITSGAGTTSIVVSYIGVSGSSGTVSVVAANTCSSTSNSLNVTFNNCANTWTGSGTTDWHTASNWNLGLIPTSTDDVVIPGSVASSRMPIISSIANSKTITNNGTITMTASGTFNAYGNIINNGTFTTVAGSTVAFNGSTAQTITGVPVLHNVTINNTSGGVKINSAVTVKGTITLTKGVLTTNSKLTINFDAGGNIGYNVSDAGSISDTISGRRDVNYKTHYLSSPFSGVTSGQVAATTPIYVNPYWKMYSRNFTNQNWIAVVNLTTPMPLGTGFTVSFVAPAPLILRGKYNHGFTLVTPGYSNATVDKYLIVGNPYPSTIDWESAGITKTNVQGAIYYWDGINNRSASYVGGVGTNGGTQFIPAMQSVLVATTGTGGDTSRIVIRNAARTSLANPGYLRVASEDILRIKLETSDPSQSDETVIRFNEMTTSGFDSDFDANKILNTGTIPSVYTMSGLTKYSINSYASADSAKVIPVFTKLPSDGTYTLRIGTSNPDLAYVLVDKKLGVEQPITESYTYDGLKADNADRFELQMRESITTGIHSSTGIAAVRILSAPAGFIVKSNITGLGTIEILDVTGNLVKTLSGVSLVDGNNFFSPELEDGLYVIRVNVDNASYAGQVSIVK